MKKSKRLLCAAVAVALTLGIGGAAMSGCVAVNNEEDVKQVIARVDISKDESFAKEFPGYADAVKEDEIIKRDLLLAYINVGSSSSGSSTGDTFKSLVTSLVSNSVVTQYATVALLKNKVDNESGYSLAEFKSLNDDAARYEYILGGANSAGVKKAKYSLYSLLNNTLDSYEKRILDKDDEYSGSESRSTPSNIDAKKEDYLIENYGVYTGYKGHQLEDAGEYEALTGTKRTTRRKAYASLISYLKANYLISKDDKDTSDVLNLTYVKQTYLSYLKAQIITEYGDMFEEQMKVAIDTVDENGVYTYIKEQYANLNDGELIKQKKLYSDATTFESAMGNLSDTSFILYTPDTSNDTEEKDGTYGTYGYVYNILLPFSQTQSLALTALTDSHDSGNIDDNEFYYARNNILKGITTTDQRSAWFNGATDYSFNAADSTLEDWYGKSTGRNYLFFENNLTKTDLYESLDKYIGKYSYNGKVAENKDGSYKLVPNKIDIDGMLNEFAAYIEYTIGANTVSWNYGDTVDASKTDSSVYYGSSAGDIDYHKAGSDKEIDYSKLVYATGKVDFGNIASADMFVKDNNRYKAMAAVNELQYAYTTDTGVLSQYIGYSVSAYETNYIKEFEYAAQQALRMGAGTFKVCCGSYGWHLIYVTEAYTFNENGVYATPVWTKARIEEEGTFENMFYNWIKDSDLSDGISKKQSNIIYKYDSDTTVTLYTNAYKELTELK